MSQAKVLIVEDDGIIAHHVQTILKKHGYVAPGAIATGSQAIEVAHEWVPDLVLMDISLQGEMNGIEAARQIRSSQDIPVIYLTAFADTATLQKAKITDPFGYVLKPFDERMLVTNIEMALNKHHLERRLRESEELFRTLAENQGEGMVIIDPKNRIAFSNPAMDAIAGVVRGGLIGHSPEEFTDRPNWENLERILNLQQRVGKRSVTEIAIRRPDGEIRQVRLTATSWIKNGEFSGIFGLIQDITEQKLIQQAEKEQRNLAEALRNTASALAGTLNIDEVFDRILDNVGKVVPHDGANIMLLKDGKLKIVRGRSVLRPNPTGEPEEAMAVDQIASFLKKSDESKPVIIDDLQLYHQDGIHTHMQWLHSYVGAPIRIKGQLIGFLNLGSRKRSFFNQAHSERLQAFADQAALAIENARLYQEIQNRAEYLLLLNKITLAALHSTELDDCLQEIAHLLGELYHCDGIYITLWDESRQLTIPAAAYGYTAEEYKSISHDPGDKTLTLSTLKIGKPLVAEDVRNSPFIDPELGATFPLHSLLAIPLIADNQKLGAILIGYRQVHTFSPSEITSGEEIAAQVALAISKLRLYAQIQKLAITDELTSLYNRRGIFELGKEQVSRASRNASPLSLIWLDIDHFKEINDQYGHPVGDEVICVVADRCRNSVKGRDLIGRYGGEGGDELIILLVDTSLSEGQTVAERLRQRIMNFPAATVLGNVRVTVSLGVTAMQNSTEDLVTLLNRADKAMYAAKAAGRNCVVTFSE